MTTRFQIDLTHPGAAHRIRGQWFIGPRGPQHLAASAAVGLVIVLLFGLGAVLPRHLRYSSDLEAIARLKKDVASAGTELETLRANLRDIRAEAARQVRWAELLPALSHRLPDPLKIEKVALSRDTPPAPPGQPPQGSGALTLQVDATTPAVPGGSRLVDIANFMAALAQDPTVARQFQLRTWEVRPSREGGAGEDLLHITVRFAEKQP